MRIFIAVLVGLIACAAWGETAACAHRGDSKLFPENTLPAFESAVEKGAKQIEFDCQLTKDGEVVLMHDGTIDRTTNAKGKVGDYTLAELKEFDAGSWFAPKFAGTPIPTLVETLETIPPEVQCNVHLKESPGLAAAVTKIIVAMDRLDQCFLACKNQATKEARTVEPGIRICNMERQSGDREAYIKNTLDTGATYIQLYKNMEDLKPAVDRLHDAGVTVNFYFGNTEQQIRSLAAAGIDYILTDDLDLCIKLLSEIRTASANK
jgi:glycerophosphoryl diester phosphodiesterase